MGKPSIPRRRVHFVEYRWQSPCTSANKIYDMIVINHLFDSLISNVQGRNNRLLPKLMNWFKNMDSCHFYSSKIQNLIFTRYFFQEFFWTIISSDFHKILHVDRELFCAHYWLFFHFLPKKHQTNLHIIFPEYIFTS